MSSRRARSLAIRLAAWLFLGALLTTAAAYLLFLNLLKRDEYETHLAPHPAWSVRVPPDWPRASRRFTDLAFGRTREVCWAPGDRDPSLMTIHHRYGWPARSFQSYCVVDLLHRSQDRLSWDLRNDHRVRLLTPAPFGFALDTAFYAGLSFALRYGPGFARRQRRRARNHCPTCNYDLAGAPSPICPECGNESEGRHELIGAPSLTLPECGP
jgi:hypothetical protein